MKKLLLSVSLMIISVLAFSQGNPFPNYQPQGSATTRWSQQGAVQGIKGLINGVYADTATANIGYIDFYPGSQIFTTNDKSIWVRDNPAYRWIKQSPTITNFTFLTDSSVVICFENGSCDTLEMNNFTTIVNNIVNNFVDSSVTNIGDSILIICNQEGSCDTINIDPGDNYFFLNDSTIVVCDSLETICVGDSCYVQQICDTIPVPKITSLHFDEGIARITPGSNIVKLGDNGSGWATFGSNRQINTFGYNLLIRGRAVGNEPFTLKQEQLPGLSSSIQSWNHRGSQTPGQVDYFNPVSLYVNYTGNIYADTIGFFGPDRHGYMLMTNSRGNSYHYSIDDMNAKQVGVFFDTYSNNNEGVTIFAQQLPSSYPFANNPQVDSTFLSKRVAVFKTNQDVQFPNYPNSRDDGDSPDGKGFYADADGNVLYGEIGGGGAGTLVDANNGLSVFQDSIVQLFGPLATPATLLNDRYLTQGAFGLFHNGNLNSYMVSIQNVHASGTGLYALAETVGLYGQTTNGTGVFALASGGTGLTGQSTAGGIGVYGVSELGLAGRFDVTDDATNTVEPIVEIRRRMNSGTAASGIGGSVDFYTRTSTGSTQISNQIISKWTTATHASRTSQFIITGVNSAVTADLLTISGSGETRLNKYGVGSFTAGTAVYLAAYKSDGTLMEFPPGGVGGGGGILLSANNGLSTSTAGTIAVLGQNVSEVGNPAILLSNREIPMGGFTLAFNASATQAVNILQTTNSSAAIRARVTSAAAFSNTGGQANSEIFGDGATVAGTSSSVFGKNASGGGSNDIVLGANASTGATGGNILIATGGSIGTGITGITAIGTSISHSGTGNATLIGSGIVSTGRSTGMGNAAQFSSTNNFGLGEQVVVAHTYSGALGFGATTTAANQLVLGASINSGTEGGINDIYWGEGVLTVSPNNVSLNANSGSGADVAGGSMSLNGSRATGNATPGVINFKTSVIGSSGSTLQTLATRAIISDKSFNINETRFEEYKGVNVAAANDLTLGIDGNLFTITGSTQVNAIATANWQAGSTIGFIFTGAPLVKHNTAGGAGTATMLLAGSADFQAAAGDNIEFRYDGTNWHEIGRTLATSGSGPTMTADNGLTKNTATNVQLGSASVGSSASPLLHTTYINTTSSYHLEVNGNNTSILEGSLMAVNSGNGTGLYVSVYGGANAAAHAHPVRFDALFTSGNTVEPILQIIRSTITGTDGIGGAIQFRSAHGVIGGNNAGSITNSISSKWVTAGTNSQLDFNSPSAAIMSANSSGVVGIGISSGYTATRLNVVDNAVAGASIVDITTTSTAAASDLQKGINVSLSGVNSNSGQDTYGVYSSNTHTGSSSTNVGFFGVSSGATTNFGVVGRATGTGSSAGVFADNTTTGYGLWATSAGGTAVQAETSGTGTGVNAIASGSGTGVSATSGSGTGGAFITSSESAASLIAYKDLASTNTAVVNLDLIRNSTGTPTAGIGVSLRFSIEDNTLTNEFANAITSTWTNVTHASRTSTLNITGVLAGSTVDLLTLAANGSMQLRGITATSASAITAANGMIVYVTDTDATFTSVGFWGRENGAWVKL